MRRAAWPLALVLATALPAGAQQQRNGDPWARSGRATVERMRDRLAEGERARNVVLFLGDGMGISTITAARIFDGQQHGQPGEENELSFEQLPHVGLVKVYETNQQVPDSAGTMTAIMTGVKTKAGVLGVDDRVKPGDHRSVAASRVRTLLEEAEERGVATGVVTTTSVTHATPAATYAHSASRAWQDDTLLSHDARKDDFPDIARQLVEMRVGDGIDVVLGGGREHFLPANGPDPEDPKATGARWDERDLVSEWTRAHPGSAFVWNAEQLAAVDPQTTHQVLGLFAPEHMAYEADRQKERPGEPSLTAMTAKAIEVLAARGTGFVLVVEGGRIDHAHHSGNAYRALVGTVELARAVERARQLTSPEDTLLLVTADHGHPLTLAGYATRGNPILGKVVENDLAGEPRAEPALDGLGHPWTTLLYPVGPGHAAASDSQPAGPKHFFHDVLRFEGPDPGRADVANVDTTDPDYLQETLVPLDADVHSGEDVPVYAGGPGSALLDGVLEQNVLYHAMRAALGWDRE